jgi:biotin transport system substrate-specific component
MQKTLAIAQENKFLMSVLQVLGGSIFLALVSQISVPFIPVPMSMQTLAVFTLGLTLGSRKAALAVAAYLVQGTLGLPVFAGGLSLPLWFMGPRAGYLIGFVAAAFIAGLAKDKNKTALLGALVAADATILGMGGALLSLFTGLEQAYWAGVYPFLMGDATKIGVAFFAREPLKKIYSCIR